MMHVRNQTAFVHGLFVTSRHPRAPEAVVVVRANFVLKPGQPIQVPEGIPALVQGTLTADVHADGDVDRTGECLYPSDFADFKLGTDILLRGTCYAPGGVPIPECPVKHAVGAWSKAIRV